MELTIYEYPKCSTCSQAKKSLKNKGNKVTSVHIVEQTPSVDVLRELVRNSGLDLQKFFNVSGVVYREMGLKDKLSTMSELEKLQLLSSNGMLIKRPIVTDGHRVTVGYNEAAYEETWGS